MNTSAFSLRMTRRPVGSAAFTLIELLVVIAIIAVLAGLLLPVVGAVQKNARKVSAKNTEVQIVAAINSYFTEYSQYPVPASVGTDRDYTYAVTGSPNNGQLFNVLRAISTSDADTASLNSRRINYFEGKNIRSTGSPKDGFINKDGLKGNRDQALQAGDFVDPWGNLYGVRMDSNYTNVIMNPFSSSDTDTVSNQQDGDQTNTATNMKVLRTGVVAFSYGEDGLKGNNGTVGSEPWSPTPGDDVVSWQ